jgi:hypothetical protein
VRFEDLCSAPEETLARLSDHCALDGPELVQQWARRLRVPTYYHAKFTGEDFQIIAEEAGPTASRFGYDPIDPGTLQSAIADRIEVTSQA